MQAQIKDIHSCSHCGTDCKEEDIFKHEKHFCCAGCLTVFELLQHSDLCGYYDLNELPGISPKGMYKGKYSFLQQKELAERFIEFSDGELTIVSFFLPDIHCSSCIWLLENLNRLNPAIIHSQVNFPKKTIRIHYKEKEAEVSQIADLLATLGYAPSINLGKNEGQKETNRKLIYKMAIAGFVFGNVMLLALPEYFEFDAYWLSTFAPFFRWMMLVLSLPVVFYSGWGYFTSAYKALRKGFVSIDVPLALGIVALFGQSVYEVLAGIGAGYFDSLAGLIFFLLLGKIFQQKTYESLSFERDYRSYFPLAVLRKTDGEEQYVAVNELLPGDTMYIKSDELIPADSILVSESVVLDNSFVTGESKPIERKQGDHIYAGGRVRGKMVELIVSKAVSQSYLTQLWNNQAFSADKSFHFRGITNRVSQYFTAFILLLSLVSAGVWYTIDPSRMLFVVSAILIVACPCALAMSAPFSLGNMLRIFGRHKLYLKNAEVIESMAQVNHVVFDKTGTITQSDSGKVYFEGNAFTKEEEGFLSALFRQSNHPLSKLVFEHLDRRPLGEISDYRELPGKGIEATVSGVHLRAGSARFIGLEPQEGVQESRVYILWNGQYRGFFKVEGNYRSGLREVAGDLKKYAQLSVISGDNDSERSNLLKHMPGAVPLIFNQTPQQKLDYIEGLQQSGELVMMVGDGLNDAGALRQSDVGIAITENVSQFSPACEGILDAREFRKLPGFIRLSKKTMTIIKTSFAISFGYNIVGLSFAITGMLSPLVAAILMPISSITVVVFTTLATNWAAKKEWAKPDINHVEV
jgi:P-type Cu+ transporter